ncbi:MAG: LutB/LldF family L-lactate oxidation iron-sulfur protein [Planctomycetota bacterium]|nr:LutB/LldF family L-lactate oxidation iron-sulfur protein [Planctomycetota bacterium]
MTSKYAVAEHNEFLAASAEALASPNLQIALSRLGETLAAGNKSAFEKLPGSSLLRDKARAIKDETLAHLDVHLATLEKSILARGGHVHFAADAADANEIVQRIIRERGVQRVVKSKSMVTEEIHLNKHLEEAGVEVTETDFGEFIIQVAGERPSHLVGPALHKTAEEMAVCLNDRFDQTLTKDPAEMAQFARGYLRQKFAEADLGITGGNFLVAETGTVVIISNEGNARLTTSVPKIMVSIVGIEKVIPKLSDLPIFLKILARAATGQKLSIYTSMVTGPRKPGEGDGPEEFHLILLDNGRSRILGSPMRESLFCIRCGACLNICPVYRKIGGHAYGGIYSGPIGAVISPLFDGLAETYHQPHASSLCGACQVACPVKIQIPELLIRNRAAQHAAHVAPKGEEFIYRVWSWMMRRPWLYRMAGKVAAKVLGWKAKGGWVSQLPGPLAGWTAHRDFPTPAATSFRDRWKELEREEIPPRSPNDP